MVEKIYVRPEDVRGLGNIVIPKSLEDYETYESVLAEGSDEVYGTVYTMSYNHVPDFDGIVLSSDKDILSYADSDVASISAQLTNAGDPVAVSGETVTFEVRKVSDDSLVETLTSGTTNSSGIATTTMSSRGTGDVYIKAECTLVSKRYDIKDTKYYADNSKINSWGASQLSYATDYNSPYTISNGETAYFKVSSLPTRYVFGFVQGSSYCQLQKDGSVINLYISGQTAPSVTGSLSVNDIIKFEKVSDTEQKIYINDNLIATISNHSMTAPNPMIRKYNNQPSYTMEYVYVL